VAGAIGHDQDRLSKQNAHQMRCVREHRETLALTRRRATAQYSIDGDLCVPIFCRLGRSSWYPVLESHSGSLYSLNPDHGAHPPIHSPGLNQGLDKPRTWRMQAACFPLLLSV
jgi:hypothetical protein